MKCDNCGYKLPKGADRCPNCSKKIEKISTDDEAHNENSTPLTDSEENSAPVKAKKNKIDISLAGTVATHSSSDSDGGENTNIVLTDKSEEIKIVSANDKTEISGEKKKKMTTQNIVLIVIACAVVLAIIIGVTVKSVKKNKARREEQSSIEAAKKSDVNTPSNDSPSVFMPPDVSVEFTTGSAFSDYELEYNDGDDDENGAVTKPSTTAPAQKKNEKKPVQTDYTNIPSQKNTKVIDQIRSFLNKKFYMDGVLFSDDGSATELTMALDGESFEMLTTFDENKKMAVYRTDGKVYMKDVDEKIYLEMTSAIMKMVGLNADDMSIDIGSTDFNADNPTSVTESTYDGKKATTYLYSSDGSTVKITAIDDEIKEIVTDSGSRIQMTKFSSTIPPTMVTLDGFKKAGMIEFFKNLM